MWKRLTDADFLLHLCLSGQDIPGQTWVTRDMALSDSKVSADLIPSARTKPVSTQQLRWKEPALWKNAILLLAVETSTAVLFLYPLSRMIWVQVIHALCHFCIPSNKYARSLCNLRVVWRNSLTGHRRFNVWSSSAIFFSSISAPYGKQCLLLSLVSERICRQMAAEVKGEYLNLFIKIKETGVLLNTLFVTNSAHSFLCVSIFFLKCLPRFFSSD